MIQSYQYSHIEKDKKDERNKNWLCNRRVKFNKWKICKNPATNLCYNASPQVASSKKKKEIPLKQSSLCFGVAHVLSFRI